MKLTANLSLLYTELPMLERFAAAAADGFTAVEIQFPYDTPADELRIALDDAGLECVLINIPAGDLMSGGNGLACVAGREADFEAALLQCVDYVRVLRPRCVNVLAGRAADDEKATALDVLRANVQKAVTKLAPFGVQVTLEAINTFDMPGFLISSFDDMRRFTETSEVDIRMQFDIYHMARMKEPVESLLEEHGASIGHIQFADVPGRHEPGSGELDFEHLFAVAEQSGYQGWYGAEYRPEGSTSAGLGWMKKYQNRSN
ncbi:MAG: hydroxypyruvate isomerase [Thalassolituus sp.]|nr:MAG: hydroxypyruvate isomerase [Thalassolituus sp.]